MTWLIAVALRSVGAMLFFGFAFLLARALHRVIPNGDLKMVLYDRSIQKRHPWKFFFLAAVMVYGLVGLIALIVYR